MVALLNISLIVIAAIFLTWAIKYKTWKPVFIGALCLYVIMLLQPSYFPKGVVVRSEIPAFESSDEQIQSKILAPKGGEFYDERVQQKIEAGLPFIEKHD